MRELIVGLGLLGAALVIDGGVQVAAEGSAGRPLFGVAAREEGDPDPLYMAVGDGHGGIAGYAETALLDGETADFPATLEEAVEWSRSYRGLVVRVFDRDGQVVGYWADEYSFVDEPTKDDLVARGWRYLEGSTPNQYRSGEAPLPDRSRTVPPSTGVPPTTEPG